MKKYLAGLLVVGFLFAGVSQAKASTLDDILNQVASLQKSISGLKDQLTGLALSGALKASDAVKVQQVLETLPTETPKAPAAPEAKLPPTKAVLQQNETGTTGGLTGGSGTGSLTSGSGTGGSTSGISGTGAATVVSDQTKDQSADKAGPDISANATVKLSDNGDLVYATPDPLDPNGLNLVKCWLNRWNWVYRFWHPVCNGLLGPYTTTNAPSAQVQQGLQTANQTPASPSADVHMDADHNTSPNTDSSTSAVTISGNFAYGQTSDQIKAVQDLLIEKGYLTAGNDSGYYGKMTVSALKAFQLANGIPGDGTAIGPKTRAVINSLGSSAGSAGGASSLPILTGPITVTPVCITSGARRSPPSVTILSPNGGEVFTAGQQITVKWTSCNVPANTQMAVILGLVGPNGSTVGSFISSWAYSTTNSGYAVFSLPTNSNWAQMQYGLHYKVLLQNNAFTYYDLSDNLFTINGPQTAVCSLNQALVTSSTTVSQYVASANASTNATRVTYRFTSPNGPATITQLSFAVTGANTASSIQVGNVSAPFVGGVATFNGGINIAVPAGNTGVNVDAYISYPNVGPSGIASGTTSAVTFNSATYNCGSTNYSLAVVSPIYAPTVTLVGSKPTVTVSQPSSNTLVNGLNEAIDVTITADPQGPIKINAFQLQTGSVNASLVTTTNGIVVKDASNNVVNTMSTMNNSGTSFITLPGWGIQAGQTETFKVFLPVNNVTSGAFLSTVLATPSNFSWTDIAGGATTNQTGTLIYNFPTNSSTIHN